MCAWTTECFLDSLAISCFYAGSFLKPPSITWTPKLKSRSWYLLVKRMWAIFLDFLSLSFFIHKTGHRCVYLVRLSWTWNARMCLAKCLSIRGVSIDVNSLFLLTCVRISSPLTRQDKHLWKGRVWWSLYPVPSTVFAPEEGMQT